MNKVANTKTAAELFLYAVLVVMGASIVFNPWVGEHNPLLYIAVMFVIFAFFAFFAYFIGKEEEGDYELLLLSLVDVVMAILIFYFKNGNLPVLLSFTLSAWSFFYISLKLITAFQYKDFDYKKYIIKNLITVVILLLSAVTIFRLFNDDIILVLTLYGYYFIIVAALNILEVCLCKVTFDPDDNHTFKLLPSSFDITRDDTVVKPVKTLVEEEKPISEVKVAPKKKDVTIKKKEEEKKPLKKAPAKKTSAKTSVSKSVASKNSTPKKSTSKKVTAKKVTTKKSNTKGTTKKKTK